MNSRVSRVASFFGVHSFDNEVHCRIWGLHEILHAGLVTDAMFIVLSDEVPSDCCRKKVGQNITNGEQ